MNYCRNVLSFEGKPDYQYLRGLFENEFVDQGYKPDFQFDWQIHKQKLIEEKIKKEEEEAERLRIEELNKLNRKNGKKAGLTKLEQQRLEQKKAFEEQEAERKQRIEEKKKQKKEKFEKEQQKPEKKTQKEILA